MYCYDLLDLYPRGLFLTAFFLYKHYLVLMPDPGNAHEDAVFTSMIRVHDLTDNMKLVGSYDFPLDQERRRHMKADQGNS